jgi:hypothetical protein
MLIIQVTEACRVKRANCDRTVASSALNDVIPASFVCLPLVLSWFDQGDKRLTKITLDAQIKNADVYLNRRAGLSTTRSVIS